MSITNVYIPIEISSRELEAKVLLASYLVHKDLRVILGKKKQLIEFLNVARSGIFLSIWGAHKNFRGLYRKLKSKGHKLVVMDEEGLLTLSEQHYKKKFNRSINP